MSTVDQRIVKMKFDNSEFQSKITPTINSINELNQATDNIGKNTKGMSELSKVFSSMETTATQAGLHIKDVWLKVTSILEDQVAAKIVNIGKQITNALSFGGIKDGFAEYELKMGSIQTIMAGTGESLETVNTYLDELNIYADKTIYSFADMTHNIGKFTNAGVKLKDAVAAIQGVANVAAVSGANTNEASRAMYNFAQALSAGYVKLIDWKSIENANMATVEFKDTLLEVASAVGTVEKTTDGYYKVLTKNAQGKTMDGTINATRNFNDSLQQQWMTTEVLTKALRIYATDVRGMEKAELDAYEAELKAMGMTEEQIKQFEELGKKAADAATEIKTFNMLIDTLKEAIGSGWAQTWEILVGDFEEAKELWTEVGNVLGGFIDNMSKARNEMLKGWDELNGRVALINALKNAFHAVMAIVKPVSEAMREIFPPLTAKNLKEITQQLLYFTNRLIITDETAEKVKRAAKGFFAVIDTGLELVKQFISAISPGTKIVKNLATNLLDIAANLGDLLVKIDLVVKKTHLFENAFKALFAVIKLPILYLLQHREQVVGVFTEVGKVASGVFGILKSVLGGVVTILKSFVSGIIAIVKPVDSVGKSVGFATTMMNGFKKAIDNVQENTKKLSPLFEGLKKLFEGVGRVVGALFKQIGNVFNDIAVSDNPLQNLLDFFKVLISALVAWDVHKFAKVGDILDNIGDAIQSFVVKVYSEALLNAAKAIGILALALGGLALLDTSSLLKSVLAISVIIGVLTAAMAVIMKAVDSFKTTKLTKVFKIFGKEFVLFDAVKMSKIATTLFAVSSTLKSIGLAVLEISAGMAIVAKAAEGGHLLAGFLVVSLIIAELTGISILLSKFSGTAKGAGGLIALSAALLLVVQALKQVSDAIGKDYDGMTASVGVISAILLELTGISIVLGQFSGGKAIAGGLAMIEVAAALLLVVQALKRVSNALNTDGNNIINALGVLSIMLVELTGVMAIFAGLTAATGGLGALGMLVGAGGMIAVAAAMLVFVQSLKAISDLLGQTNQHVWQALGVIAVALVELSVGLFAMSGSIPGSYALVKASEGLIILAGALKMLGMLKLGEIVKSLITMGVALVELAVGLTAMVLAIPGAKALVEASKGLVIFAAAMKAFASMSVGEIAKALISMTLAMAKIVIQGTLLSVVSPFVLLFAVALTAMSGALIVCDAAIVAFSASLNILISIIPTTAKALYELAKSILKLIPVVIDALVEAFGRACHRIAEYGPDIKAATLVLIDASLSAVVDSIPKFGMAVVKIIEGVLNVIAKGVPDIADGVGNILVGIMKAIAEFIPKLVNAAMICGSTFMVGLGDAIVNNSGNLIYAFNYLTESLTLALYQWILNLPIIGKLIPEALKEGIIGGQEEVVKQVRSMVDDSKLELDKLGPKAKGSVNKVFDIVKNDIKQKYKPEMVNATGEVGDESANAFDKELNTGLTEAGETGFGNLKDLFSGNAMDTIKGIAAKAGIDIGDTFGGSLEGGMDGATDAINDFLKSCGLAVDGMYNLGDAADKTAPKLAGLGRQIKIIDGEVVSMPKKFEDTTKAETRQKKATDDLTSAFTNFSTSTGSATKATMKHVEVTQYASGVVDAFVKQYGHLYSAMGDTAPVDAANVAIRQLAETTYLATVEGKNAVVGAEKTKASIEEMVTAFTELKTKIYDTVKAVFSGDSFFQNFEAKTEKTMDELLVAMQSNVNGVASWTTKIAELGERGLNQGLLQQLAELGPKGYEYVNAFSNATVEQIAQANELFAQAGQLPGSTSDAIVASYANAGLNAVTGFANGIFDNMGLATKQSTNLGLTTLDNLKKALQEKSPSKATNQYGRWLVEGLRNGINETHLHAVQQAKIMCNKILLAVNELLAPSRFYNIGKNATISLANGLISEEAMQQLKYATNQFYSIGQNIAQGLVDGMKSKKSAVEAAANELSKTASDATKKANDIHSPSKLYRSFGQYDGEGFALGLLDSTDKIEQAALVMSDTIRTALMNAEAIAESDMELHPVIVPVLDMSEVKESAGLIGRLFPSQSMSMASSVNIGKSYESSGNSTSSTSTNGTSPASINFTQNNYSPKALSRYEIYRNTQNQLAQLKGVLA